MRLHKERYCRNDVTSELKCMKKMLSRTPMYIASFDCAEHLAMFSVVLH